MVNSSRPPLFASKEYLGETHVLWSNLREFWVMVVMDPLRAILIVVQFDPYQPHMKRCFEHGTVLMKNVSSLCVAPGLVQHYVLWGDGSYFSADQAFTNEKRRWPGKGYLRDGILHVEPMCIVRGASTVE